MAPRAGNGSKSSLRPAVLTGRPASRRRRGRRAGAARARGAAQGAGRGARGQQRGSERRRVVGRWQLPGVPPARRPWSHFHSQRSLDVERRWQLPGAAAVPARRGWGGPAVRGRGADGRGGGRGRRRSRRTVPRRARRRTGSPRPARQTRTRRTLGVEMAPRAAGRGDPRSAG